MGEDRKESCEFCYYFRRGDIDHQMENGEGSGFCHRYPPGVSVKTWAIVSEDDFCGELTWKNQNNKHPSASERLGEFVFYLFAGRDEYASFSKLIEALEPLGLPPILMAPLLNLQNVFREAETYRSLGSPPLEFKEDAPGGEA